MRSNRLQGLVRSRAARLVLAGTLIAASAWAFLPHINYRIASPAFVNAELMRVAAPFAGELTSNLPRKGDFIDHSAPVSLVEARAPDQRHLQHLLSQYAVATKRAGLARKQLAEITAADEELIARIKTFSHGTVARLGYERDEAREEHTGCVAEAAQRRDIGSRLDHLVKSGTTTAIKSAEAQAFLEVNAARCQMLDAKLKRLEVELKSAEDSVFLRHGANDAPYSQQQRDWLLLRRQDLEIRALEETLQSSQMATEIEQEKARLARQYRFDVSLPAGHVVSGPWQRAPVLALADQLILYVTFLRTTDRRAEADRHEARLRALPHRALPAVDVFIPTYNEPFEVLEKTITGALCLDYPHAKVWVLDDGRRPWLKEYCESKGVGYLNRPDNAHAKAGNINHALTQTSAEFVAIFDADFVPQRNFLMRTIGFFADPQDRHRAGSARLLQSRPDADQSRAAQVAAGRTAFLLRCDHAEPRRLGRGVLLRLELGDAPRGAAMRSAARCRPSRSPKTCC